MFKFVCCVLQLGRDNIVISGPMVCFFKKWGILLTRWDTGMGLFSAAVSVHIERSRPLWRTQISLLERTAPLRAEAKSHLGPHAHSQSTPLLPKSLFYQEFRQEKHTRIKIVSLNGQMWISSILKYFLELYRQKNGL